MEMLKGKRERAGSDTWAQGVTSVKERSTQPVQQTRDMGLTLDQEDLLGRQ